MKKAVFIILLFFVFTSASSQNLSQKQIKHLFNQNESFHTIQKYFNIYSSTGDKEILSHKKHIIKYQKEIYCFINGTGQLFKIKCGDSLFFERIDTTHFWGYNNGCFVFADNGNLYNLGGSGIWRVNGQLRKFNFINREWDIVPLNLEIPISFGQNEGIVWWNKANRKLYTGFYIPSNSAIRSDENFHPIEKCYSLDVSNFNWNYLGDLSQLTKEIKNHSYVNIVNTPMGLLICANLKFYILDFENNIIYESSDKHVTLQTLIQAPTQSIIYYNNGYFYKSNPESIDSIKYQPEDWNKVGSIYNRSFSFFVIKYRNLLITLGISVLILLIIWGLKMFKKQIISKYEQNLNNFKEIKKNELPHFTDSELEVIILLLKNQKERRKTTIDEINYCLGLQNRPLETQKAQRHKNISNINKAFIDLHQTPLILNEKMPEDKRSLLYFLNSDFQIIIENNIKIKERLNE